MGWQRMGCLTPQHCCSSTPSCVSQAPGCPSIQQRNNSTGHQAKTKLPPLWHKQLSDSSPGLFLFPGTPLVSAAPALSSCVQCSNEFHSTDIKGTSTTLLNLFLLGAFKSCFSRSLRRSIKSPDLTGKQCPFLDWHHQSNQQRHLRTGCTTLENEITLKRFLLAYLPANDRTNAKHSLSVLGCSERQSLCRDIFFFFPSHPPKHIPHIGPPHLSLGTPSEASPAAQRQQNSQCCIIQCLVLSLFIKCPEFCTFGKVVLLSSPCKYLLLRTIWKVKLL